MRRATARERSIIPNVEQIASERIGRETVTYVSNIYKYYIAYQLMFAERQRREAAKAQVSPNAKSSSMNLQSAEV